MPETVYKVIKENYTYRFCSSCGGTGFKTSTFRGRQFNEKCVMCGGTGKRKITHRTEIPLTEALEQLKNS